MTGEVGAKGRTEEKVEGEWEVTEREKEEEGVEGVCVQGGSVLRGQGFR